MADRTLVRIPLDVFYQLDFPGYVPVMLSIGGDRDLLTDAIAMALIETLWCTPMQWAELVRIKIGYKSPNLTEDQYREYGLSGPEALNDLVYEYIDTCISASFKFLPPGNHRLLQAYDNIDDVILVLISGDENVPGDGILGVPTGLAGTVVMLQGLE